MPAPASDIVTFLATQGLGLTAGTNLFYGPIRAVSAQIPVNAVFVQGFGGAEPIRVLDTADHEIREPMIHVRVRWSDMAAGDTKARDVMNALREASVSGYLDVALMQSEPDLAPQDEQGHFFWGINARMVYKGT